MIAGMPSDKSYCSPSPDPDLSLVKKFTMSLDIILNKDDSAANYYPSSPPARRDFQAVMSFGNILNAEAHQPSSVNSRPLQTHTPSNHQLHTNPQPRAPVTEPHPQQYPLPTSEKLVPVPPLTLSAPRGRPPMKETSNNSHGLKHLVSKPVISKPASKRRGPFELPERAETAKTRKWRACVRCRNQRIRCRANENDPKGCCVPCQGIQPAVSKKVIHRIVCMRKKCTEIVLYRSGTKGGSLDLTKRWEQPTMAGLDAADLAGPVKAIKITFGLCEEPIVLKVCRFTPRDGDVLVSNWLEGSAKMSRELPPYAIADMRDTAAWFQEYVERNAFKPRTLELALRGSHPSIQATYKQALLHCQRLAASPIETPHKTFMKNLFKLWFATRHMLGSPMICGSETLKTEPEIKQECSATTPRERLPVPPMIAAQFDNLNILQILAPLRSTVLQKLEDMLAHNKPEDWYPVYLAVYILLHEVSVASKDRFDDAIANSAPPYFVEKLHDSANIILVHWHYYRRNANPPTIENHKSSTLSSLTDEQFKFVVRSYKTMQALSNEVETIREQEEWEHELFWISQMLQVSHWNLKPGFVVATAAAAAAAVDDVVMTDVPEAPPPVVTSAPPPPPVDFVKRESC